MLQFILNNKIIKTNKPAGTILLDFIRNDQNLKGTKIGCREGDCGACTVLVGELKNKKMIYKSVTSCLTPLGNIKGKHVVTIEGINGKELSPVQNAMHQKSATQCGFCTPGFVVSLTGHCMSENSDDYDSAIASVSGNICRCTGYKSIEKAVKLITSKLNDKPDINTVEQLIQHNYIPEYFADIPEKLQKLNNKQAKSKSKIFIGGGTDIYVQKPDETEEADIQFLSDNEALKEISVSGGKITIGAAVTVSELMKNNDFQRFFPTINKHLSLISSQQIRNIATIGGNFVNASPIGDLTIIFLALNSTLIIENAKNRKRKVLLKKFYKGYKNIDLKPGEYIEKIEVIMPIKTFHFNFEKVSKRKYLDIASVNTAVFFTVDLKVITDINISAGGLAPVPVYFTKASQFLTGKDINTENILKASELLLEEVSPISDIRGSAEYKKLLLKQLFKAHFHKLFPRIMNKT